MPVVEYYEKKGKLAKISAVPPPEEVSDHGPASPPKIPAQFWSCCSSTATVLTALLR